MLNATQVTEKFALDANGLNDLKVNARDNSPESIKKVAKQFEALFLNMVLKSMRNATPQDGVFDSEQSRTFTAMLDQQLSQNLSSKGLGLAEMLTKQLTQVANHVTDGIEGAISEITNGAKKSSPTDNLFIPELLKSNSNRTVDHAAMKDKKASKLSGASAEFHQRMSHHAEEASRATGVPAKLMLGQAALESGWGKHEIKSKEGTPSYNLFGMKATPDWKGKVVEAHTTEYIKGVKHAKVERFRAYDSYADSFKDFANLIQNNPRYKQVMANLENVNHYARAMQNSGYATDPKYATKLASVINKISV